MNDSISRQAAIDALEWKWAGKAAMDAIKNLPSAQPEPCEDAQHILDYLDNVLHPLVSPEHWNVYSELHDMIAALPSAQPEIIRCKDCLMHGVCRFEQFLGLSGYCSQAERREEGGE